MNTVYERVAAWNALRYKQEYNAALAASLLEEEFEEWAEATAEVDKLDALCDIVYVAQGIIWKCSVPAKARERLFGQSLDIINTYELLNYPDIAYHAAGLIAVIKHAPSAAVDTLASVISTLAIAQMMSMGLSFDQVIEALTIVCDANDSKSVFKTASDVKANKDKGSDFVAPEARLCELLKERLNA